MGCPWCAADYQMNSLICSECGKLNDLEIIKMVEPLIHKGTAVWNRGNLVKSIVSSIGLKLSIRLAEGDEDKTTRYFNIIEAAVKQGVYGSFSVGDWLVKDLPISRGVVKIGEAIARAIESERNS